MVKSGKAARKVGPLGTSPSHLMHRALQLALDIYSEEMGPDGLTQRQFAVLEAASLKAGPSMSRAMPNRSRTFTILSGASRIVVSRLSGWVLGISVIAGLSGWFADSRRRAFPCLFAGAA